MQLVWQTSNGITDIVHIHYDVFDWAPTVSVLRVDRDTGTQSARDNPRC